MNIKARLSGGECVTIVDLYVDKDDILTAVIVDSDGDFHEYPTTFLTVIDPLVLPPKK